MNADIKFACAQCGQHIACGVEHAGIKLTCPTCQATVVVPAVAPSRSEAVGVAMAVPWRRPTREAWKTLALGLGLAVFVACVPFLNWMFRYLGTVIHELGHWILALVFAYPAIPAFHVEEGGVTLSFSRSLLLLLTVYGFLGFVLWQNRSNRPVAVVVGLVVGVYAVLAHSGYDRVAILAAGHWTQILIAGVFLYRAWSGTAILIPAERPFYAAVGLHMVGVQLSFAWRVFFDAAVRQRYIEREGVVNDFVRMSREFGLPLDVWIALVLLGALAVLPLSYLAFRCEPRWQGWLYGRSHGGETA